jgi:hypothetical protein
VLTFQYIVAEYLLCICAYALNISPVVYDFITLFVMTVVLNLMCDLCCTDFSSMSSWSCLKESLFWQNKRKKDEQCMATSIVLASLEPCKRKRGGSVVGHKFMRRDREAACEQIMRDYFVDDPLYSAEDFRRRYVPFPVVSCHPFTLFLKMVRSIN